MKINEIYPSIQGESTYKGRMCIFLRLAGCNLDCTWCDSKYTKTEDVIERSQAEIIGVLEEMREETGINLIEITGGEPLVQKEDMVSFIPKLLKRGFEVLLETNGTIPIPPALMGLLDLHIIMDIKPPSSGMADQNYFPNLKRLNGEDEVKFVIADDVDLEYAIETINHESIKRIPILISPMWSDRMDLEVMAEKFTKLVKECHETNENIIFQLQMHKVIWGNKRTV